MIKIDIKLPSNADLTQAAMADQGPASAAACDF